MDTRHTSTTQEENSAQEEIYIVYGTHTGNSMLLADQVEELVADLGFKTHQEDTEDFDVEKLPSIKNLLLLVSTEFEGNPPLMAEDLLEYLQSEEAPDLSHLSYSVLALGDSAYFEFCQAGRDFDKALEKLGAKKIAERVDCDADYDEGYELWIAKVMVALSAMKK